MGSGYDTCGGGCEGSCGGGCGNTCGSGCGAFSGLNDPYAGMYYSGGGCGGCGVVLRGILLAPIRAVGCLFGGGYGDCGYGCGGGCGESRGGCGEMYIGDYINNPPGCEPCDGYGNMRGYRAGCPTGNCDTCSTGGMPVSGGYQTPYAAPRAVPGAGCKNCGGGSTTYYSANTPQTSIPAASVQAANYSQQQPQQQYVMQDNKLIGGPQQQMYQKNPVRQASGTQYINR